MESVPLRLQKGMLQMRGPVHCSSSHPGMLYISRLLTTDSKSVLEDQMPQQSCHRRTGEIKGISKSFWLAGDLLGDICRHVRTTHNAAEENKKQQSLMS